MERRAYKVLGAALVLAVLGIAPVAIDPPSTGGTTNVPRASLPPSARAGPPVPPTPHSALLLSTYLGGSAGDGALGVGVDAQGNISVAGTTSSADLPATLGAYDSTWNDGQDVFVAKFDPALQNILYLTYLGGGLDDEALGMAMDDQGNVYVSGHTDSTDFPATPGAFDGTANGGVDAFVAKFNATGALVYSTYLGGSGYDRGYGIGTSGGGTAIVSGYTSSPNFPTTPGAFDTIPSGEDAFATKLSADGSTLVYSTMIGGTGTEIGYASAVDTTGAVYVGGLAISSDLPTTPGAYDRTPDSWDAFLVKVEPTGGGIAYGTYLGGRDPDWVESIAVDAQGNAYVAGQTASDDFPVTPEAIRTSHPDTWDAFVAKFSPDGSDLLFGTYLGGSSSDHPLAMASHPSGALYIAGAAFSYDFPVSPDALDPTMAGGQEGFVLQMEGGRATFLDSTFLGGESGDLVHGLAFTPSGEALVAGQTWSLGFPVTPGSYDTTIAGGGDAFVSKVDMRSVPILLETDPPGLQLEVDGVWATAPTGFFCPVNTSHSLSAPSPQTSPGRRHVFVEWSDGAPQNRTIVCTAAATYAASYVLEAFSFSVVTFPPGPRILVDGVAYSDPSTGWAHSDWCTPGTSRSLDVPSPQDSGTTRYVFLGWSDGGPAAHVVSCDAPVALFANFSLQYAVQLVTDPPGLVLLLDGAAQVTPATVWCDADSPYEVSAAPQQGNSTTRFLFAWWAMGGGWTSCGSPAEHRAVYSAQHRVRVETNPPGIPVVLDGRTQETPVELWCDAGTTHNFEAPPRDGREPTVYGFTGWSDGGSRERALVCDGPHELVAVYALLPSVLAEGSFAAVFLATVVAPIVLVPLLRGRRRPRRSSIPGGPSREPPSP